MKATSFNYLGKKNVVRLVTISGLDSIVKATRELNP
jgi:hypothetical protein